MPNWFIEFNQSVNGLMLISTCLLNTSITDISYLVFWNTTVLFNTLDIMF